MAITLSTGAQVAIATTYGTSVVMSAITNASEAVATLAAGHGVVVGDFLEVTSGWDLLNGRIVRVKTVATNDVTFELINTTSTTNYPAGSGAGSVRRIQSGSGFTAIGQVKGVGVSGGEQNFTDVTTLSDRVQKQMPTTRSPQVITLNWFDDPTLAFYAAAVTASDSSTPIGLRFVFSSGSRLVVNAYISVQKLPSMEPNAPLTADLTFTAVADAVRYPT